MLTLRFPASWQAWRTASERRVSVTRMACPGSHDPPPAGPSLPPPPSPLSSLLPNTNQLLLATCHFLKSDGLVTHSSRAHLLRFAQSKRLLTVGKQATGSPSFNFLPFLWQLSHLELDWICYYSWLVLFACLLSIHNILAITASIQVPRCNVSSFFFYFFFW